MMLLHGYDYGYGCDDELTSFLFIKDDFGIINRLSA
jgi:hypothetical protein